MCETIYFQGNKYVNAAKMPSKSSTGLKLNVIGILEILKAIIRVFGIQNRHNIQLKPLEYIGDLLKQLVNISGLILCAKTYWKLLY